MSGAINFIDSNPTTDQVEQNQRNDLAAAQVTNSLLSARDQRRAALATDRINRGIASIFADSPAATPSTTAPGGEVAVPISPGTAQVVQPSSSGQGGSGSQLANVAPMESGGQVPRTALTAFATDPRPDKFRRAIQFATGQEGGGEIALRLATSQAEQERKRQDSAHAEAIKAFGAGDFELARALNQQHGLGLDSVFSNPSALQTSKMIAGSIAHMKLEPAQSIAYMDAATKRFSEVYGQTNNMREAMNAAGQAGMTAARGTRTKSEKFLETPNGYYDPTTGQYEKDAAGKVVKVPDRRLFFDPNRGDLTAAQERSNLEIDAARQRIAGMNPAEVRRRSAKATNTGRENPDYDPGIARAAALASRRKVGADEWFDSGSAAAAPLPAAPTGRVRTYVPGKGFQDAAPERSPVAVAASPPSGDLARRFASDPGMQGKRLGQTTARGVEVFDEHGRLIGHYH